MKTDKPEGHENFTASNGWLGKFLKRHLINLRVATNVKNKSVEERLPLMKKNHRMLKTFRQPPPLRHPKYGRFPPSHTYASDQVYMIQITNRDHE